MGEERDSIGAKVANQEPIGARFMINGEPTENKLALASKGALHVELVDVYKRQAVTGPGSQHVGARILDRHFSSFPPAALQFIAQRISHRTFIWSDGFNVDQAAGERKQVHAGKA